MPGITRLGPEMDEAEKKRCQASPGWDQRWMRQRGSDAGHRQAGTRDGCGSEEAMPGITRLGPEMDVAVRKRCQASPGWDQRWMRQRRSDAGHHQAGTRDGCGSEEAMPGITRLGPEMDVAERKRCWASPGWDQRWMRQRRSDVGHHQAGTRDG